MMPNLLNPTQPMPPAPPQAPPGMPLVGTPTAAQPVIPTPAFAGNAAMQSLASPPPPLPGAAAPILAPQLPGSPASMPSLAGAPAAPDPDDKFTEAELIEQYIALRDEKKRREATHKEQMSLQFDQRMDRIEAVMKSRLDKGNLTQFKAVTGTAFTKTVTRYSVGDADVLMPWIVAHGRDDMLKRDIKQDPVREYFQETGQLPPGVSVYSEVVVQFRR